MGLDGLNCRPAMGVPLARTRNGFFGPADELLAAWNRGDAAQRSAMLSPAHLVPRASRCHR
jgi:hypothetical protein